MKSTLIILIILSYNISIENHAWKNVSMKMPLECDVSGEIILNSRAGQAAMTWEIILEYITYLTGYNV